LKRNIFLATISLFAIFANGSCSFISYKPLYVDEGVAHLSFEYPKTFGIQKYSSQGTAEGDFSINIFGKDYNPQIMVLVRKTVPGQNDPVSLAEKGIRDGEAQRSFVLEERGQITIAGITGEETRYSYGSAPDHRVQWEVFFEKNGLTYVVAFVIQGKASRAHRSMYEHLLATFNVKENIV
jgi:hypothetical protein